MDSWPAEAVRPARGVPVRVIDLAWGVAAAAFGLMLVAGALSAEEPAHVAYEAVVGGAACVLIMLFRRRAPLGLAVGVLAAGVLSMAVAGMAAVVLCNLAVRRPPRVCLPVTGVHAAIVLVTFDISAASTREYWESSIFLLMLDAVSVTAGMLAHANRRLVDSYRDRAVQAEDRERMRVAQARRLERERIAREMHDVLAHRLSLLAIHAGALEFRPDAPEAESRAAGVIRHSAHEALEDLREVIRLLREDVPDGEAASPQPTLADLPDLIAESRRAGAAVEFEEGPDDPDSPVPTRIGRHAYRIVQEALTNARKHAPGCRVRVAVDRADGKLRVEVSNRLPTGPHRAPIPGAGAGLIGLRERVALVGGGLEHGPTPEGDFRLRAWLPLP